MSESIGMDVSIFPTNIFHLSNCVLTKPCSCKKTVQKGNECAGRISGKPPLGGNLPKPLQRHL